MTTDTELRDLLVAEAGGPTREPAGWDDIMRRGQHRQRARRVQGLALFVVVAGVAITAIALSAREATVDTGPSATEPAPTVTGEIDPSTVLRHGDAKIQAARAEGTSLTLFFDELEDLCRDLRPVLRESEDQIAVGLVDAQDDRGIPWGGCGDGMRGPEDPWGTIDLRAPAADRALVDLSSGQTVTVQDGKELLFPTRLPASFDVEVFDQDSGGLLGGPEDWFFLFTAEGPEREYVSLYIWADVESNGSGCDGEGVEVRGTEGCFAGGVPPSLTWDEGGRAISLSIVSADVEGSALDELLAIAEGLEPLRG
jgi:hypothetical protein